GHGLGALGHGVLGELSGEDEAHGGLDLAGREGALLVVAHELAGLVGDLVEDVRNERIHDGHALGGDASIVTTGTGRPVCVGELCRVRQVHPGTAERALDGDIPASCCPLTALRNARRAHAGSARGPQRRGAQQAPRRRDHRRGRCSPEHPLRPSPEEVQERGQGVSIS
ncbi:hypothetical protein T484DRAFT_3649747, partial [Baffinella frigidus]